MTDTQKAAPRPWTTKDDDTATQRRVRILDANGDQVVMLMFADAPKIASLIVQAVNAYDAMREALLNVREWLLDVGVVEDDGINHPLFVKANNAVVAALAAAEGKGGMSIP